MKKNIKLTILVFGGLLALSSCTKDENQEVFVGDSFSSERQQIINDLNALSYPVGFSDEDIKYPEYKNMDPDAYTDEKSTSSYFITGYYGYVDLGLSVDWATSNLNSVSPVNKQGTIEEKLAEIESEMGIEPMEKPSFANYTDNTYPIIMTYEEYLKAGNINELREAYAKYKHYCTQKTNAHDRAIADYNSEQYNNHQYLYNEGGVYYWARISQAQTEYQNFDAAPLDIAGNVNYDIATNVIGEGWSMPTKAQWQELLDKCTWEQHDKYYIVTGPSGKQIVLPRGWYLTSEKTSNKKVYVVALDNTKEIKTVGDDKHRVRAVHTK